MYEIGIIEKLRFWPSAKKIIINHKFRFEPKPQNKLNKPIGMFQKSCFIHKLQNFRETGSISFLLKLVFVSRKKLLEFHSN